MKTLVRSGLSLFILLSILTGLVYPVVVTGIAQALFPTQAQGSLIKHDGTVIGSSLVGQNFTSPKYFWGRLSATTPMPNNASNSGGSNLGPTNPALLDAVKGRLDALHAADPSAQGPVPVDLVTASGSGLDPDISVAAAEYQVGRVAHARAISEDTVRTLVERHTRPRTFGLFGEPRVNVLELNLDLDALSHP